MSGPAEARDVVLAILAKDKAVTLPLYLACIAAQTFPKNRIHLYIRANDSTDSTNAMLQSWVAQHGAQYKSVTANYDDIGGLSHYKNHEWDRKRCLLLGRIRQESVDHAKRLGCDYFVVDLDNFIIPDTLQRLYDASLPVVAPLLRTASSEYANYHFATDKNGYYAECPEYADVLYGKIRGFIAVTVVHCAYLIRYEALTHVSYEDGTPRYEYIVFSEHLRRMGVGQYLDNRQTYGLIIFLDGEPEAVHGGFDHDELVRRLNNLAAEQPKLVNDRPAD